jgi:serine/threonine protein kinase
METVKRPRLALREALDEAHARDQAEALARVGTRIGHQWCLDRLLGLGGMAAVYSATHSGGSRVALKVLHQRHRYDLDLVTRFRDEREIARTIRHPACVKILWESVTDDGTPLLALELLEGKTLHAEWRERGRLELAEALRIADVLLDFLVTCHAAGVVHRDLKPSNVFLADSPGTRSIVKVIDFGVAMRATRRRTQRRVALGTPSFMPPEQARGTLSVDGRADLFAVGAILYVMISGSPLRTLVDGDDELLRACRESPVPMRTVAPGLPPSVAHMIERAIAHHPGDRFDSAATMLAEVRALRAANHAFHHRGPSLDATADPNRGFERRTLPSTPSSIHRFLYGDDASSSNMLLVAGCS